MQIERHRDGSSSVVMDREEYGRLVREAHTFERVIALRLMGDCGLRANEVPEIQPNHISRRDNGTHYKLEVHSDKHRETWLPERLERTIYRYTVDQDMAEDAPLIDKSKRAIQNWVKVAAQDAADATDDRDYERVSSHDLRRCWANHLLVEEGVSPRIVMTLGGWGSYNAIEPYLAAPTERNITQSMREVEL